MKILIHKLTKYFLVLSFGITALVFPGPAELPALTGMVGADATVGPRALPGLVSARPRRVNIPYFSGAVSENQSAIFWFGKNEPVSKIPGRNYVDVRIAYSPAGLFLRATAIDYYLWYKQNATVADDLTSQDALAIYVDVGNNRSAAPQAHDYYFLVGAHHSDNSAIPYRRQARGTGTGWDPTWNGAWSDYFTWEWDDVGPNNNTGGIDYGRTGGGTIPWSTFGLSGPPAEGTVWGLSVQVYDQDVSSSGPVLQEYWPETFSPNQPGSWGELRFGLPGYTPPPAVSSGSTRIRATTPQDNTVEDAWMGGGTMGIGGHMGSSDVNHGSDPALFVGSEIQPTHFPFFNKSYLRFSLASLPPGKVILSATLTLHHWGGADLSNAVWSIVWLSSVLDPWNEMTITWNNAPLAQENFSWTGIPPKTTRLVWPGDPYTWDASQAVADAYAAGQPLSIAMYDSATGRDTSKYLTGSEVGLGDSNPNWDIAGRPRLDVVWGDPVTKVIKKVSPPKADLGNSLTYTLSLLGSGQPLSLTDTLPAGLSHPISMSTTFGGDPSYHSGTRQLTWSGTPAFGQVVTITYQVTVTQNGPKSIMNTATLASPGSPTSTDSAVVCVGCYTEWIPLVRN